MSREIRMVPKGWEHPKNERGHYQPMFDKTFKEAADKWIVDFMAWQDGSHPYRKENDCYFWEWDYPPDAEYYLPVFESEPNCFQVYETVSEGTPVSPVFESEDKLIKWLIAQGHSEKASRGFVENKWAPSMIFTPKTGVVSNIDTYDIE